jgi:hypothetical protein
VHVQGGDYWPVVGAWFVAAGGGCVGDGGNVEITGGHVTVANTALYSVADQDVIDQLALATVDPGEALRRGDSGCEVPQPRSVAVVRVVMAGGADLRAGWAEQDLGGRGLWFVVEITQDDHRAVLALAAQQLGGIGPDSGGFGGSSVERVHREAGPLILIAGREPAAGEGEQLGLQMTRNQILAVARPARPGRAVLGDPSG